jgi:hypothetical protein
VNNNKLKCSKTIIALLYYKGSDYFIYQRKYEDIISFVLKLKFTKSHYLGTRSPSIDDASIITFNFFFVFMIYTYTQCTKLQSGFISYH